MPRPPRAEATAANVVVRFSPDELAALDRLAAGRGMDRSALLRALVAEEAERCTVRSATAAERKRQVRWELDKRGRPKGMAGKRKP